METTDVLLKPSGDGFVLALTLDKKPFILKLHKHKPLISSTVPMYVSENGLVEQIIPDLYEVCVLSSNSC